MILSEICLDSFRSHKTAQFPLGPVTLFSGDNGIGKTNTLEAIWVLATTRSFRTSDDRDFITWGETAARVSGGGWEVAVAREPKLQKYVTRRGVLTPLRTYLGTLRAVLFTPQSLELLLGSPAARRKFLNYVLLQARRDGAYLLASYQETLRQRNSLLKQQADADSLDVWDEKLAEFGSQITAARADLIEELERLISPHFSPWNPRGYRLELPYRPSGVSDPMEYRARLGAARSLDLRFRSTSVGPHRDDLDLLLDGRPASRFASRGEQRSLVLALLGATVDYLTEDGVTPILLMDDVFSELDREHRAALVTLARRTQTVITTTEPAVVDLFERSTTLHHALGERIHP